MKEGYICRKCAITKGAVPVEGHRCTSHMAICECCHESETLCHTSDWDWPNNKTLEKNREI